MVGHHNINWMPLFENANRLFSRACLNDDKAKILQHIRSTHSYQIFVIDQQGDHAIAAL